MELIKSLIGNPDPDAVEDPAPEVKVDFGAATIAGKGILTLPGAYEFKATLRTFRGCSYEKTYILRVHPRPPMVRVDPAASDSKLIATFDPVGGTRLEWSPTLSPAVWNLVLGSESGMVVIDLPEGISGKELYLRTYGGFPKP